MTRQSKPTFLARLAIIALVFLCASIAAAPPAASEGPTIAVTQFSNDAGAPQSTIDALSHAAYAALGQGGKYTPVGGGPLQVQSWTGGDLLGSAIDAAQKAGAAEVITTDLQSVSGGTVTYRLSAYRVDPLAPIRSGTFTQSSLSPQALTAGFATNFATLHAPRIASGTVYAVDGNNLKADFGEATGAGLGDVYNVVRDGQKVAQAKVVAIDLNTATLAPENATAGYAPRTGDALVGVAPQPPIPPAAPTNANTFNIFALAVATGAALLAIGHHGQPAGSSGPAPSPTPSTVGGFSVSPGPQSGTPPSESFQFIFSQPVNTAGLTYTTPTFVSYEKTNGGTVTVPAGTPVSILGGPAPSFNTANTTLTINATTLLPGDIIIFSFTSAITSTLGISLAPISIQYTASVARHPLTHAVHVPVQTIVKPVPAKGGSGKAPQPAPQGGHNPTPR